MRLSSRVVSITARIVLLLALGAGLAACGPWRSPSPGSSPPPRKLQVMSFDGVMGENAKPFEKETGIQVSFTIYAPHGRDQR